MMDELKLKHCPFCGSMPMRDSGGTHCPRVTCAGHMLNASDESWNERFDELLAKREEREGWQWVPNNIYNIPDEMAEAGYRAGEEYLRDNQSALVHCKVIFEAMCAAAPQELNEDSRKTK